MNVLLVLKSKGGPLEHWFFQTHAGEDCISASEAKYGPSFKSMGARKTTVLHSAIFALFRYSTLGNRKGKEKRKRSQQE